MSCSSVLCLAVLTLLLGPANIPASGQELPDEDEALATLRDGDSERTSQTELQQDIFAQAQGQVSLSGRVVLEDGTPPPESAVIESVCGGRVRPECHTDAKGRFSFRLGQGSLRMEDASRAGSTRVRASNDELAHCELRASLVGYLSASLPLEGRLTLDNQDIGTIVLWRLGNVEGTTISATSLAAPKDARKAYDKGLGAKKKGNWADARKQFQAAVKSYPGYATAWYELGLAAEQLADQAGAREAYAKSLASDERFVKPYLQLAGISATSGNWRELADTTSRLLRIDPYNYPGMYLLDSVAQFKLDRVEEAERSARQAVKLDKQNRLPGANYLLGVILIAKGQLADAAGFLKSYLRLAPAASDATAARARLAEIETTVANAAPAVRP